MLIALSIVSLFFLIQFLMVKRRFGVNTTPSMGILYYSSMFFLSIIGGGWFIVFLCNIIYWIYAIIQG